MPGSIKPASVKAGGIKVTGCVDIFDDDPYAELDDDDFEWDSDMDGEISSSLSEDEKDYHADDPWHALLVLGLRVYSQSSPVTIKVREGDETDDDEPAPGKPDSDVRLDGRNTSVDEDNTKQPSASSEAIYTPGKDDQSNSMTKTLHEHDSISSIEKPSDITIEQKK
ncbi:hypothetical protein M436DRAFT_66482 [Aureobasidium namibiae CBS 147.97]|uniref:Uncharacterized protein n=1 Tax=Aureobasidium namibiae CBS 147.97 TaxID=1043004 RepID=A0A074X675_9PEZI